MRVVLTAPSLAPEFGGPAIKVRQLADSLRSFGQDVRVVGAGGASDDAVGVPTWFLYHGTPVPADPRPIARAVRDADVVHVLGYRDPVGMTAALAAWRRRVPYVLEPVGTHRRRLRSERLKWVFDRTAGQRLMGAAARIIATSAVERDELRADGLGRRQIVVRANGIDVADLLPLPGRGAFRARHAIPAGAHLVASIGRIAAKKGLTHLIRAIAQLPDVWLAVAGPDDGDGTLRALEALAKAAGTRDRTVIQPSGIWGAGKARLLADADVFALPSATENFGNAAAEAAAVGVPVLVSSECGVKEWLSEEGARVVSYGDVAGIRQGLTDLLGNRAVDAARADAMRLRSELSWGSLARFQADLYRQVIEEALRKGGTG